MTRFNQLQKPAAVSSAFSRKTMANSAWYRYGFLALILVLVIVGFRMDLSGPPNSEKHLVVFTPLMLLFNHLAFIIRWPRNVAVFLQVFAMLWLLFVLVYVFTK